MKTKPSAFLLFAAMGIACGSGSLIKAQTIPGESAVIDGYVIRDGVTYQVRNGQATPVAQDQVLRITTQGEIIGFDGQRRKLSDKTMLTLDGRVIPAPPGTTYATPQSLPSGPNNQLTDNLANQPEVIGENVSGLAPGSPNDQGATAANPAEGNNSSSNQPMNRVEGTSAPLTTGDNEGGPNYNNNDGFINPALVSPPVAPATPTGVNADPANQVNSNTTTTNGTQAVAPGSNITSPRQQSNAPQGGAMNSSSQSQNSSSEQSQSQQRTNNPNAQPTTGPGSNNDSTSGATDSNPNNSATPNAPDPTERPNSSNARSGNSDSGSTPNGGSSSGSSGSSGSSSSSGASSGASSGSAGGAAGGVR